VSFQAFFFKKARFVTPIGDAFHLVIPIACSTLRADEMEITMADTTWEVSKISFCDHVQHEVTLESEIVHPVDFLPDPARVIAHRCSSGLDCNLSDSTTCIWAGTNPNHDPFK
jgi:hypothetical protein